LWRGTVHVAYLHGLRNAQKWITKLSTYYVLGFPSFAVDIEAVVGKLQSCIVPILYTLE